jgi:hypothetical protein
VSLDGLLSGDTVTLTTWRGSGAYGTSYDDPVDVDCRVQYERKMARDSTGTDILSELTIYVRPQMPDGRRAVDAFAVGSQITHEGRQSYVIHAQAYRGQGPPLLVEVVST